MTTTRPAPHLLRNAVLAGLVVVATSSGVVLLAGSPGAGSGGCPAGQDWIVAQPLAAWPAGYAASSPPQVPNAPSSPSPPAVPPHAAAPLPAGCVDPDRLPAPHPPAPGTRAELGTPARPAPSRTRPAAATPTRSGPVTTPALTAPAAGGRG